MSLLVRFPRFTIPIWRHSFSLALLKILPDVLLLFAPTTILETAAGSGVVTRALAPKLAPNASYVVTDLNQPMLDHAARRQDADARITWRQANAPCIAVRRGCFRCRLLPVRRHVFSPTRVAGYREAKRVLKSGGHFVFNVWDRIEEKRIRERYHERHSLRCFPRDPPRFMARTPHGYHDVLLIRDELAKAGFCNIAIETRNEHSHAPSARPPSDCLLPRDSAAQRDRGSRGRQITSRHGTRGSGGLQNDMGMAK